MPGPLSSSMNLYALSECLHAGAAAVVLPRFDSAAARAAITAEGVTRVVAVPTMLRLIAERAQLQYARDMGLKIDDAALTQAELSIARQNQLQTVEQLDVRTLEGLADAVAGGTPNDSSTVEEITP